MTSTRSIVSGIALLVTVAALAGANAWLMTGSIGPIVDAGSLDYVIQLPPMQLLATWIVGCFAALGLVQLLRHRGQQADALAWSSVRYLAPLLLLAFPLVAVGWLFTPWIQYAPSWLFLFIDLRRWLVAGVVILLVASANAASSGSWLQEKTAAIILFLRSPRGRPWLEGALVLTLAIASIAFSPKMRLDSAVIGDEPKYLRFLENWYQGNGLDVSQMRSVRDLPINLPPNPGGNWQRFRTALSTAAADLAADVRYHAGLQSEAPPRATVGGNWFLEGKRGGLYQVHNPGTSVLLFPGYLIDRYFLNSTATSNAQLPTTLYATGGTLFVIYLLWAVALFRLLTAYSGDPIVSWLLSFAALASIPATAFSYQYYPESAGGLLITIVTGYVLLSTDTRRALAVTVGFLAGYLPWLHPRFGPVTALAVVAYAMTRRRTPSAVVWFWIGVALPLAALSLYNYSIAGSLMPWALYDTMADGPGFNIMRVRRDVLLFWTDSRGGLIVFASVYLLLLAGLVPMWRRRTGVASYLTMLVLTVAALAASHAWSGGETTPGRLIASAVPLLMVAVAEAFSALKGSRAFVVLACVLGAVSVHNGLAYNTTFNRENSGFLGAGISGFTAPFPQFSEEGLGGHATTVTAWAAFTILLFLWPLIRTRFRTSETSWTVVTASVLLTLACGGSVAAATRRMPSRYLIDPGSVRETTLRAYLRHDGGTTWLTRRGAGDPSMFVPNPAHADLRIDVRPASPGEETELVLSAGDAAGSLAWGNATVDFGDGRRNSDVAVIGRGRVSHVYADAGKYVVNVALSRKGADPLSASSLVVIPRTAAQVIRGIPTSLKIDAITVADTYFDVDCVGVDPGQASGNERYWVWMGAAETGERDHFYSAQRLPSGDAPSYLRLRVTDSPRPDEGQLMLLIAGSTPSSRSTASSGSVLSIRWPSPVLTEGGPLRLWATEADR